MAGRGGLGVEFAGMAEGLELVSASTKKLCEHMELYLGDGPCCIDAGGEPLVGDD